MTKEELTVWQRLAMAKAAMPSPVKDTDAYKYKYADLSQVKGIIDSALFEQGFLAQQFRDGDVLTTSIIDAATGESVVVDHRPLLETGTDQQRGSSETYQRRYALLTVCGLAPEDDDGAAASKPAKKERSDVDPLTEHKARLWAAVSAYAQKTGQDAKKLAEGCKERQDHEETAEWYTMVAEEFEAEIG